MIQTATLVSISPTDCWIERCFSGDKRIMLQHEGCEPFALVTIGYDHRYTCNSMQYELAESIVRQLGYEPKWK